MTREIFEPSNREIFDSPNCKLLQLLEMYVWTSLWEDRSRISEDSIESFFQASIRESVHGQLSDGPLTKVEIATILFGVNRLIAKMTKKKIVRGASAQVGRRTDPDDMLRYGYFHPFFFIEFSFEIPRIGHPSLKKTLFVPILEFPDES